MSILKKPYELSVWSDVWDNSTNSFTEEQVAIIGSDTMTSQYRVLEPKLKRNVNGSNELTFKMHRRYKDSATGEQIINPFIDLIANETKLKLKYNGKWYDLLVKNIQQDSNNATYTYSATDLHITELSKNGYGLVLDTSLMNNMGTVNELAARILEDTGWSLTGTLHLDEMIEEQLVEMTTPLGVLVYVPYSSLKNKPEKFQYFTTLVTQDEYGVYSGEQVSIDITETNSYITDEQAIKFGFYYPIGWKFIQITPKRVHCKVYTHKSAFNPALNKVVYFYNNGDIAGYSETEYITPNLISNLITNNTFKSTTGWTGSYSGGPANQGANLNAEIKSSTLPRDLLTDIKEGNYDPDLTYTPCLRIKLKDSTSIVVNSGPYDNKTLIKEYSAGQKFVLFYKEEKGTAFTAKIGARKYSPLSGQYNTVFDKLLMTFSSSDAVNYIADANTTEFAGYRYIISEVNNGINLTQKETKELEAQLFLSGASGAEYLFSDFQLFPFIPETEGSSIPMLPVNVAAEAKAVTKYYYYNVEDNPVVAGTEGYVASAQEYKYLTITDSPVKDYRAVYSSEKIRSIDVKQSNYFNAIQSLCEAFECWPVFEIGHTDAGKITSKSVILKQYIDKPNHAGFRYGVNLKQSKRTIDSKQVVTKLIVPDSVNEYAPNGFCSIARAGANPSGENYIYNFQYYINMGLLNAETVDEILYNPGGNYGEISGYYTKLLEINQQLTRLTDDYTSKSLSLMQAHADLQVAENGRIASEEKYQDAADSFAKITGYDFRELNTVNNATNAERDIEIARRKEQIENDTNLQGLLTTVAEYYSAWQKYCFEEIAAKNLYDTYKAKSDEVYQQIETYNKQKTELNKAFFAVFYRFIQEGTWKGDEHTDNEKYYFDAKTTSDNSCMPKVTYSFSVLDLSGIKDNETWTDIKGYEAINFNLADKTWVEDPEIFGNAREEVVITEITYSLDEPDKNTIKVQNYKDQFADLFQKQTATIQQVQFAKGAWNKSTKFTEEQPAGQAAFLQDALANAELVLQNAGEQSVVWDKNGITVTDINTPSQQLRIIGGAIMMRDEDNGGLGWKVGITPKGINAKLITAGQINTGLIQIMNGDEPYFRWDAYGITAYYFDTINSGNSSYNYGLNTRRGVRFDRLGIYGYRNPADKKTGKLIDGATWHPESIEEVQKYAQFALTWDGLYLNLGHATYSDYCYYNESTKRMEIGQLANPIWHAGTAQIGKTSNYLFNKWVTDTKSDYHGLPYYDPSATDENVFAKIFAVGGADGNDELAIYDDGTLVARRIKLTGSIEWTKNSSPSKSVYGKVELTEPPKDNTPYVNIPEKDGNGTEEKPYVWHQIVDTGDTVYAHTDNGGATWEGPFLITGRSIESTTVEYCMADRETDPKMIDDTYWSDSFPTDLTDGKCIFTRAADKYNNGQQSTWRYSVGYIGTSNYRIVLDNDYASIPVKNQVNPKKGEENIHELIDSSWSAITTARVYYGDKLDTHTWEFSVIDNHTSNGLIGTVSQNIIIIKPQTTGKLAGEEHVVGIKAYNKESDTTLYTSFTAAKLHAGDDAIGYKIVGYPTALVRHHNTDNVFTPDEFKLQALKKIGANQFEACTGYWKYSIDNNENEEFINDGAAASEIIVQPDILLRGVDKLTLKSLNVFFYLNNNDEIPADKEIITIAENGKSGIHGTQAEAVRVFRKLKEESSSLDLPPTNPDKIEDTSETTNWTTVELSASEVYKFVYTSTGVRSTVYDENGNGTVTYSNWTTPELWAAYASENISQKSYATFLKLMNGKEGGIVYDKDDGKLYIKSEFIKSNNILVTDSSGKTIFSATAGNKGSIQLAGFNVSTAAFQGADNPKAKMYYGFRQTLGNLIIPSLKPINPDDPTELTADKCFLICPEGAHINNFPDDYLPGGKTWKMIIGTSFGVDSSGKIYATGGKLGATDLNPNGLVGKDDNGNTVFEVMYDGSKTVNGGVLTAGQINALSQLIASKGKIHTLSTAEIATSEIKLENNKDYIIKITEATTSGTEKITYHFEATTSKINTGRRAVVEVKCYLDSNHTTETTYLGPSFDIKVSIIETFTTGGLNTTGVQERTITFTTGSSTISTSFLSTAAAGTSSSFGNGKINITSKECEIPSSSTERFVTSTSSFGIKGENYYTLLTNQSLLFNLINNTNTTQSQVGALVTFENYVSMGGTWKVTGTLSTISGGTIDTSDRNSKNSIVSISTSYEQMFDLLEPRLYKFNKGTSNRFHCGFIAQEVEQALLLSKLSTQEFGGYVDNYSGEDDAKGLRYTEFIALNTWQIQKLKPRMTEAEKKIAQLEQEITELKQEIIILKQ